MEERASENAATSPRQAAGAALVRGRGLRWALVALAATAAVIAVIAVVVTLVVVTRGYRVGYRPPLIGGSAVPRTAVPQTAVPQTAVPQGAGTPATVPASAYRVARTVTIEPTYLDCRTESVCYAWFTQLVHPGLRRPGERTSDGGATWQKLASPPNGEVLNDSVEPSCPTAKMCVAVAERDTLAVTTDSGARWRLDPCLLPTPRAGSTRCPAQRCGNVSSTSAAG